MEERPLELGDDDLVAIVAEIERVKKEEMSKEKAEQLPSSPSDEQQNNANGGGGPAAAVLPLATTAGQQREAVSDDAKRALLLRDSLVDDDAASDAGSYYSVGECHFFLLDVGIRRSVSAARGGADDDTNASFESDGRNSAVIGFPSLYFRPPFVLTLFVVLSSSCSYSSSS